MICNEMELRGSIEWMARMYASQEREAVETAWSPETRREQAEDTHHMRLQIEQEVAEYLARKYGYIAQSADNATREMAAENLSAHKQTPVLQTEQAA